MDFMNSVSSKRLVMYFGMLLTAAEFLIWHWILGHDMPYEVLSFLLLLMGLMGALNTREAMMKTKYSATTTTTSKTMETDKTEVQKEVKVEPPPIP